MRLTAEGFEFSGFTIAWSDVKDLTLKDGEAGTTHIRVVPAPHAHLTGRAAVSNALGSIGLYCAAATIPIPEFVTDGSPSHSVLTQWWRKFRADQNSAN